MLKCVVYFKINKLNYIIKSYATMLVELLNLACYRVQTISNEGDTVRET